MEEDINSQLEKVGKLSREANLLLEKLGLLKSFEEKEQIYFDKDITAIGSSAHIIIPKGYVGGKADVIIRKSGGKSKK